MSYVVQRPNSSSNPSSRYRVVDFDDWIKYINGASQLLSVAGSFDTYEEATTRRDELNIARLEKNWP